MSGEKNRLFHLDSIAGWKTDPTDMERLLMTEAGLSLEKVPGQPRKLVDAEDRGAFGGLEYPTGLALDRRGHIYVSDRETHRVSRLDECKGGYVPLECLGGEGSEPRQFISPRGIAISPTDDLYVADSGNNRIQVFSLKGLALRSVWDKTCSEENLFNNPTDVAIDSLGNVYVADRDNSRIQKFTSSGRFLLQFGDKGEVEGHLEKPVHLAIDKEDRIYVVDEVKDYVPIFDSLGNYLDSVVSTDKLEEGFKPLSIAIDFEGNVYIGDGVAEKVRKFYYDPESEDSFTYTGESAALDGIAGYLVADDKGNLFAALKEMGLVVFEPEKSIYLNYGSFTTSDLDSKKYLCQWHRITIEADIPEGTSLQIRTFVSEKKEIEPIDDSLWDVVKANSRDMLVMSPPGRYLRVKVTFTGNTYKTPLLKEMRISSPRDSYLKYLPKVYREDEESSLFLARFLSIFENILSGFDKKIHNMDRYFNPVSTPGDFLPWLASWLGLVLDDNWPEEKKRELIRLAPELYKKRGTLDGLQQYIKIYTGLDAPPIIEHYKLRRWIFLGQSRLGCESAMWGKGVVGRLQLNEHSTICSFKLISTKDPLMDPFHRYAHKFSIIIPSSFCDGNSKERAIRNIIDVEKPAHVDYRVCNVGPRFRVGMQSTIGVDTYVGIYPEIVLGLRSTLGADSILRESPEEKGRPTLRVGSKSRIGIDAVIN